MAIKKEPLSITHPELAAQANGWDPSTLTAGSSKKVSWKCSLDHEWEATISNRTGVNKTDCPFCAGKRVLVGVNDLATLYPNIGTQAHEWNPNSVSPFSHKRAEWICERGHVWSAVIASRTGGRGCPVCTGKQVLPGFNDLATTHPKIAVESDGWDPSTVTAGSNKQLRWRCNAGHTYVASPHNRTGYNKTMCPVCTGKQVLPGFNDLATTHPKIAVESDGWDPSTVTAGSNSKKDWICSLGHTWKASPNSRTGINHSGCPFCANKAVLVGYNDLATVNPALAEEAFGWDPKTVTPSSSKKFKWKCMFDHIWISSCADRTRGNGCPSCSIGGFDPNREAWFYFLEHEEWKMLQIGITTQPKIRLESHRRIGWRLIEIRGPLDGHHIQNLETAVLKSLRNRQVLFANSAGGSAFDGWTEAWVKDSLEVASIKELLDMVYEDGN